jgi:RNA polymerase sigma-70 factor (sigma-E family)
VRVDRDDGLERLLAERGDQLIRAAIALAGSRAEGEELLQASLERLVRNWRRVRDDDPEGYLRRTMCNLAADNWRRRVRLGRRLHLLRDDNPGPGEATAVVDQRDQLIRLLRQLPPRQRAVIVLRYWEQRPEAEVADLLGCTQGTVKSAASRGLHKLRELVEASNDHHTDLAEDKA